MCGEELWRSDLVTSLAELLDSPSCMCATATLPHPPSHGAPAATAYQYRSAGQIHGTHCPASTALLGFPIFPVDGERGSPPQCWVPASGARLYWGHHMDCTGNVSYVLYSTSYVEEEYSDSAARLW